MAFSQNIEIDDGGTTTENNNLGTVNGNLIVKSNSTYILNGNITELTGSIEVEAGSTLIINGDIDDINGSLTINGDLTVSGSLTAEGKLEIKGSGTTTLDGGSFESTGDGVTIESGSTLSLTNGSSIVIPNGNTVDNAGTIQADDSGNSINQEVSGGGTIDENLGDCSGGCSDGTLPIDLFYFRGNSENNRVLLEWASLTEINNDFYTVERSLDGVNYEEVCTVEGAGNSDEVLVYSYEDFAPYFGNILYRLTQTDFDGQSETFKDILVEHLSSDKSVSVFPTITERSQPLSLYGGWGLAEIVDLQIYDLQGGSIRNVRYQVVADRIEIATEQLPNGYYVIKGAVNQIPVQEKFIIRG